MSSGITSTTGPGRPDRATRTALYAAAARSSGAATWQTHFASAPNICWQSISWKASLRRSFFGTWPITRIIGAASCCAAWMPMAAFVAPGPRLTMATPGRGRDRGEGGRGGEPAIDRRHECRAAFVAAGDDIDVAEVAQGVEHAKVAFTGHDEPPIDAVVGQTAQQRVGGGAGHGWLAGLWPQSRLGTPALGGILRIADICNGHCKTWRTSDGSQARGAPDAGRGLRQFLQGRFGDRHRPAGAGPAGAQARTRMRHGAAVPQRPRGRAHA